MPPRYGSPANPTDPVELWALLVAHSRWIDGCLVWQDYVNHNGYGSLRSGGRRWLLHRLSWTLHNGPIPDDKPFICHHCDNPPCINPDHLFAGTTGDNLRDMTAKGRHGRPNSKKTHCVHGHEFTPENTRITSKHERECKTCRRRIVREYQARKQRSAA